MRTVPRPTALEVLLASPHGHEVLDWGTTPESGIEMSRAGILHAFQLYADHAHPSTWVHLMPIYEAEEEADFMPGSRGALFEGDWSYPVDGSLMWAKARLVEVLKVASEIAEGVRPARPAAATNEAPKRHRRTHEELRKAKDAIRKRNARAEGRVKPRPRKPALTTADWIAATEKSLATRVAKLAKLKSNPSWVVTATSEVMRTEIGIERVRKTLETYRMKTRA